MTTAVQKSGGNAVTMTESTGNPSNMMMMALQNNADPEIIGRLMDLQDRWDAQQARKAYVEAMTEFKKDAPAVLRKDATVDFTSSKGRTHYKHATLGSITDQITTALSAHSLSASWETKQEGKMVTVTCHITHAMGHRESVTLTGPMDESGNKNSIQAVGSSVTYLQRYTLLAALGLATADQDNDRRGQGDKKPFNMPKVAEARTEPARQQEAPESNEPTVMEVTGILDEVQSTATKKGGSRYGLKIAGKWYGTFSKTIGTKAESLEGKEVCLGYIQDGEYMTVDTLAEVKLIKEDSEEGEAAALVDEISAIFEAIGPKKTAKILKAVEIDAENGEAWELEGVDKLKEILALATAEKGGK